MTQTTEPTVREMVAWLEAEIIGHHHVEMRGRYPKPVLVDSTGNTAPPRDHRSAEGERFFCRELRLPVSPGERSDGTKEWLVPVSQYNRQTFYGRHESRSEAIRLAIEAAAKQRWEDRDDDRARILP